MRSLWKPAPVACHAAAALFGVLLAACSGGGVASDPATPEVAGVAASQQAGGTVTVEILLVDELSREVFVELRYSTDGGETWSVATVEGLDAALATSPSGVRHELQWDALGDLGARAGDAVDLELRVLGDGLDGVVATLDAETSIDNLSRAADRVRAWMMHFGPVDDAVIATARSHDLVVLYPNQPSVTREVVAAIQQGVDPEDPADDVPVLGYVQVGEDERTIGLDAAAMRADPRFVGDGSGPRVDPRGPGAAGQSLLGLDPLGLPSTAGGFASYYLDDASVESQGFGDGQPDRSGRTGACFVNMGDPAWFAALEAMTTDGPAGIAGFAELLGLDVGRGFGFDGLYLDGVDTCGPNVWTDPSSPVQTEFEWTAPGYVAMLQRLRGAYPDALLMQNRGLFFFNPELPQFELPPGQHLDFVLFTSYRLDADPTRPFDPFFFADNKHNYMPKLQAEASRADGFQVLSLGFAAGPGIDPAALLGQSQDGLHFLERDVLEAHELAGFRHYLMDAGGQLVNDFVRRTATWQDTDPPRWSSTWNGNRGQYPDPPQAPTPRVGLQELEGGVESVTLRWDVALDLHPVHYVAYYAEDPFDRGHVDLFGDPLLEVGRRVLNAEPGRGYAGGVGDRRYPFEATLTGLRQDMRYWVCVRAVDALGNEDANRVLLTARTSDRALTVGIDGGVDDWRHIRRLLRDGPDPHLAAGPDWKELHVVHDDQFLYVMIESFDRFDVDAAGGAAFQVVIDADDDPFTGWQNGAVGGDLAVLGRELVTQTRNTPRAVRLQSIAVAPDLDTRWCELAIPRARLDEAAGGHASRLRILFDNPVGGDRAPDQGYLVYEF